MMCIKVQMWFGSYSIMNIKL